MHYLVYITYLWITPDAKEKDVNTQESILQESSIREPKLLYGRRLGEDGSGRVRPSRTKRLPDKLKDYVVDCR